MADGVSPISSPSFDFMAATTAATEPLAAEAEGGGRAALNWLLTWLGQVRPESETEELEAAPEQVPAAQPMQWRTLMPVSPVVLSDSPAGGGTSSEEDGRGALTPEEIRANRETEDSISALPVALGRFAAPTEIATDNSLASTIPIATTPGDEPHTDSTASSQAKHEAFARFQPQASQQLTALDSPERTDKGEIIWAAELVVREANPAPEKTQNTTALGKSNATEAAAIRQLGSPDHGKRESEDNRSPGDSQPQRKSTSEAPPPPSSKLTRPDPQNDEPAPPFSEKPDDSTKAISHQPNTHVPEKTATAAKEIAAAPAVSRVDVEVPRPLRPAQVATLLIDVPAPDGAENMAEMRLAVSQRGDQVNVRLRSWDGAITPIGNDRMQPLLQSLAEQGLRSDKLADDRFEDSVPLSPERPLERALATAEATSGNNDQQPFPGADERQKQNHDRQQHAFFLRRRFRGLNAESFDMQSIVGGSENVRQQGATR